MSNSSSDKERKTNLFNLVTSKNILPATSTRPYLKDNWVRTPDEPGILKPWFISMHWRYKKKNLNPACLLNEDVVLQGKWYLTVNVALSKHSVSATPFQLVDVKN
jgi:hypothetical protein